MENKFPFNPEFIEKELYRVENDHMILDTGNIPLHHLLMWFGIGLLPTKIFISSFSIGEEAVRAIAFLKEHRPDLEINILLDNACKSNKLKHIFHAQEYASDIRFTANHSKLLLFLGGKPLAVHSSANLQSKTRLEAHYLCYDGYRVKQLSDNFKSFWNDANP